tara:strand:+ start:4713 stop:5216 length:504 start_codon:yes stop_codon:yes gene_type:complete
MAKNSQFMTPADRELKNMTYKTLQKEVIIRGYPFEKVSQSDHGMLSSFFIREFKSDKNPSLLKNYDIWLEDLLKSRGKEQSFIHPQLRYSMVSEEKEEKPIIQEIKKPKVKREKTAEGIYKGTKKALTFKLAKEGLTKQDVIKKVLETFPDASPKSMGIWYNKALKE